MYEKIIKFIKPFYKKNTLSHDYSHAISVYENVKRICKKESLEGEVAKISALFHDIIQLKDKSGEDVVASAAIAKDFLIRQGVDKETYDQVHTSIIESSWDFFDKSKKLSSMQSYLLRDADFLESIGTHGLVRVFSYSGENRIVFGFPPFIEKENTAYNHINNKLLKMKDYFHFKTALAEAERRHKYMRQFLDQYSKETKW
ncbi:HD domain-containing protein [Desulfobacula toluolica]|uniref:Metal-dependent phosphohydrolase n=1 Tax=Desulfobacula toluolica (strain DSM 7467 / Tol2) TaxID=651182 RepID=K0N9U3_DESTT|nr:HD domain-containing protein [Desulfobacula toluolica]CCK80754.1 metal-dependent phosphohydrolase [Desulfobacula toluolica Tol2]